MDTAWIALIGTMCGGMGLKLAENLLSRGQREQDTATQLRTELRAESTTLKEELRMVEHEVDTWKEKYFVLMQEYLELKGGGKK